MLRSQPHIGSWLELTKSSNVEQSRALFLRPHVNFRIDEGVGTWQSRKRVLGDGHLA